MAEKVIKGPQGPNFPRRFKVTGGAISRGHGVKYTTGENDVAIAGANEDAFGILAEAALQNAMGDVIYRDGEEAVGIAGAAVAKGEWLKVNGSGRFIPSAAGDTVPNLGYAGSSATGDGDEVLVVIARKKPTA